jgi:putative membrane protein
MCCVNAYGAAMNGLLQVLAVLEGVVLIAIGSLEAFQYRNSRFYSIFRIREADADAVRLWVVNQGFYNIVWGVGLLTGIVIINVGDPTVGATMVLFTCAAHVILGIVLGVSEPKLWKSMFYQAGLPLVIIVLALLLR